MMGPDVERILAGINSVKDATIECIKSLSNVKCPWKRGHF